MLAALQLFADGQYDQLLEGYTRRLQMIAAELAPPRRSCTLHRDQPECLPMLEIVVDEKRLGRTAIEVCRRLRAGTPPCYVGHWALDEGQLLLNPLHLDDASAETLARRLREELSP